MSTIINNNNPFSNSILLSESAVINNLENCTQFETLLTLPNYFVYMKDLKGKFLQCNNYLAKELLGLESERDAIGLCDYDLPIRHEDANHYRNNDRTVAMKKRALAFKETATMISSNTHVTYKSIKMPLFTKTKKIAGTIGLTNLVYAEDLTIPKLSTRQQQCLIYVVLGYTMKEISTKLGLSVKTIEHYINHTKAKFQCSTRSILIQKALQLTFIKEAMLEKDHTF